MNRIIQGLALAAFATAVHAAPGDAYPSGGAPAWLTAKENGFPGDIGWNFEKFLIDRGGRVVSRYPSGMKPTDSTFLQDIADVL